MVIKKSFKLINSFKKWFEISQPGPARPGIKNSDQLPSIWQALSNPYVSRKKAL